MSDIDASGLHLVAIKPNNPFLSSKLGAWLMPLGMAAFIYAFSFAVFAFSKPAFLLKSLPKSKAKQIQQEIGGDQEVELPLNKSFGDTTAVVTAMETKTKTRIAPEENKNRSEYGNGNETETETENRTERSTREQEDITSFSALQGSLSQIHAVLDSSELLFPSSPIAKYALGGAKESLSAQNLNRAFRKLNRREAEKCWEEQTVDWKAVSAIASVPSFCFLLFLVAAL